MTVHLTRDFQTNSQTNQADPGYNDLSGMACLYVMACFMRYCLGYTQVGDTNFNLNASPLLIAQSSSNLATINSDGSVSIPSSVYTVSSANDPGRMIVLKSPGNPSTNSGVFLITNINPNVSFPNSYIVSARIGSSGQLIAESGLNWAVMENDANVVGDKTTYGWSKLIGTGSSYGGNQAPANISTALTYAGDGSAVAPRIILQSPHSTAWQVRIAFEPNSAYVYSCMGTHGSIAPGFGGNSAGDFTRNAPSLHGGLFFTPNMQDLNYLGTIVGPYGAGFSAGCRVTCVGDDTGQAVGMIVRSTSTNTSGYQFAVFGIPDNEPSPLPPNSIQRLFVISSPDNAYNNGYGLSFLWGSGGGGVNGVQGLGFGLDSSICTCSPSLWTSTYQGGGGQGASPIFSSNGGDSPFLQATELLPVDLINGVFFSAATSTGIGGGLRVLNQQPRTIGTMPFFRVGRSNFATYSTTTDTGNAWYHFVNGVFMQYGGPQVIP